MRPQDSREAATWDTRSTVSIDHSSILVGFGSGIDLDRVHGAVVDGNVLVHTASCLYARLCTCLCTHVNTCQYACGYMQVKTTSFGIKVVGQRNIIRNNLVSAVADGAANSGLSALSWSQRWKSGSNIDAFGIYHEGRGGIVSANTVAGVDGIAMLTDGHECGGAETVTNNTLHSSLVGLFYGQRASAASGAADDGSVGLE